MIKTLPSTGDTIGAAVDSCCLVLTNTEKANAAALPPLVWILQRKVVPSGVSVPLGI